MFPRRDETLGSARRRAHDLDNITDWTRGSVNSRQSKVRPNYRAIAAAAGASVSTISRYVNGPLRLRPETEQRVHDAVATLGYGQMSPRPTTRPTKRRALG